MVRSNSEVSSVRLSPGSPSFQREQTAARGDYLRGDGSSTKSTTSRSSKGLYEVLIFLAAIVTGTGCSIFSKVLMDIHGVTNDGTVQKFHMPIFQTFIMFASMNLGLVFHVLVLLFKIPFPGYYHNHKESGSAEETSELLPKEQNGNNNNNNNNGGISCRAYFYLAIPAVMDLLATAFCMIGLMYLDVSIYQLLRGSGIIFVAILRQTILKEHLYTFQWIGVLGNVLSVILVGMTAVLESDNVEGENSASDAIVGVCWMLAGTFAQSFQFVFEEKFMTADEAKVPPLLLFGMEGLWGTILCCTILYPIAYSIPGENNGSFEDPWHTYHMIMNTPAIQLVVFLYFVSIFGYNMFGILGKEKTTSSIVFDVFTALFATP
jgi:drug/metabolite transporter (DMT)-like permease